MRELEDMGEFRIGGTVVNNLRYAKDTVILAESGKKELQRLINVVVAISEEKGLHLNSEQCEVLLNGIFQVDNYSYMPHRRPREYYGTSTVVHLFRKFVILRCKM